MNQNGFVKIQKMTRGGSKYTRYYTQPVVIISSNGDLMMSPAVYEMLGGPPYLVLLYNERERVIGLRAASPAEYFEAFKVGDNLKTQKKGRMSRICPHDFTKGKNLAVDKHSMIYRAEMNGEGVVTINLKQNPEVI